jgi:DNA-directed RNA polymerase specialized sigma24 family protein
MIDLDEHLPLIAAGDAEAFARWLAGAERPLRLSLRRFAASVDTEAVMQETLLRAWTIAARVRPDGKPNALLRLSHRIAVNLALDEIRRRRGAPGGATARGQAGAPAGDGLPDDGPPDPTPPPDPLLRQRVEECLKKLPRAPRQAIDMRIQAAGGAPDASLAALVGMRLNTFLQNVTRARRLIARCLERSGIEVPA